MFNVHSLVALSDTGSPVLQQCFALNDIELTIVIVWQ